MQLPNLPTVGSDEQVVEVNQTMFRFESSDRTWTDVGIETSSDVVTEQSDGIVSADIHQHITKLRTIIESTGVPEFIRLQPHLTSRYYYLMSSDKSVIITNEGNGAVRLEVSLPRLYAYAYALACRGNKGPIGDQGPAGRNGPMQGEEPTYSGVLSSDLASLSFDIPVATPLDTPIWFRLYPDSSSIPVFSVNISLSGIVSVVVGSTPATFINVDESVKTFQFVNGRLTGTVFSFNTISGYTVIRAAQRGKKGEPGSPGRCFPEAVKCELSETSLKFTDPIIAIRQDCQPDQIFVVKADLFQTKCVSKLTPNLLSPSATDLFSGTFAKDGACLLASKRGLDPCKKLVQYKFSPLVDQAPPLVLPSWSPTNECGITKRTSDTSFDWVPKSADGTVWDRIKGDGPARYPWNIVIPDYGSDGSCDPCGGVESMKQNSPPCPG